MGVRAEFMERGGTESGLMSTTSDRDVAEAFATRADENGVPQYSLLFKVVVDHFLHCGADVSFLSCFPEENEWLFPPNTYLLPSEYDAAEGGVGGVVLETITTPSGGVLEVVEVKPSF